jgi:hypothetical protein
MRKRKEEKEKKKTQRNRKKSWFSTTILFSSFSSFLFSYPLSLSQKVLAYKNRIQSESTTTKSIRLSSAA